MLAIDTGKGVTPEVNLKECILCMPPPSVNKAAHSDFETQKRYHHSRGISGPKMDMCPPNIKINISHNKLPLQNKNQNVATL